MRYLSVCSGIEAATVAWHPLGWEAAAYAEIDPAPRAILAHHYPDTPLAGDFTAIKGDEYGPIDLLVGGTPCQSFSIAGLRGGLADDRGNLALEYLRLADRCGARWLVWENVPGVLSIDGGRAFGAILGGLAELGYGFAYRILDAQFAGVPQRRRRVFVVGYLGDWRRAAAVLFERHSLSGHPAPRREKGPSVAALTANGVGTCGADDNQGQAGHLISAAVTSKWAKGSGGPAGDECQNLIAHALRGEGFDASEDGTGRGTPLVAVEPFVIMERGRGDGPNLEYRQDGTANAILTPNGGRGGLGVGAIAFDTTQITSAANYSNPKAGDPCHPLAAGAHAPAVAFAHQGGGTQTRLGYDPDSGVCQTLSSNQTPAIAGSAVRRLTPRECERLQGFPDDYTLVPYRNKLMADGPRYKALGNSMAVPVMRWIGERIALVDQLTASADRRAA